MCREKSNAEFNETTQSPDPNDAISAEEVLRRVTDKEYRKMRRKEEQRLKNNYINNPATYDERRQAIKKFLEDKRISLTKRNVEDEIGRALYENYEEYGLGGTLEPKYGALFPDIFAHLSQVFPGIGEGNVKAVLEQMVEDGELIDYYDKHLDTNIDDRESRISYTLASLLAEEVQKSSSKNDIRITESEADSPTSEDIWNNLNDRQRYILQVFLESKAFNAENRLITKEIAAKTEANADPDNYKGLLADLVSRGLVMSKRGRDGGYWMTEEGLATIQKSKDVHCNRPNSKR